MYKTLDNTIALDDLTIIIHFAIKILNKYKIADNNSTLTDLVVAPKDNNFVICQELLNEIGIDNLRGQNEQLDLHINNLYSILENRFSKELKTDPERGKALLKNL